MSETQPEQALKELIDGQEPERAMLALLQWQFIKLAELDGTVNAIMPVLGLISKRLGIGSEELDRAFDEYAAGHGMSCEPVDRHSSPDDEDLELSEER